MIEFSLNFAIFISLFKGVDRLPPNSSLLAFVERGLGVIKLPASFGSLFYNLYCQK